MGSRVAITDKIQGNVGPLLCCFFNNNYSSVDVYLFLLSHLHEHEIHFGIIFFWGGGGGGLTQIC